MDKQDLSKLNKNELLMEAEKLFDKAQAADEEYVKGLEMQVKELTQERNAFAQIAQAALEAENDLLKQLDGALKSGGKLHNMNMQNLQNTLRQVQTNQQKNQ